MFSKVQLNYIRASLTTQNSAVPTGDGGNAARVFVTVLDEIEAQLRVLEDFPTLKVVPNEPA